MVSTLSGESKHILVAGLKISPLPWSLCCGSSTATLSRYHWNDLGGRHIIGERGIVRVGI